MKLSFVDSGQLLNFKAIDKENKLTSDDYGQNQTVANKSICKSRAGQCNISYVHASTAVRADIYKFGF